MQFDYKLYKAPHFQILVFDHDVPNPALSHSDQHIGAQSFI